jgi:carbonic anhydrase/acetyltransferase-like protein (isoleucine patch superfamily)
VRINGVVHVNSALSDGAVVPIGWIAVGDPAEILPPDRHDDIWAIQRELDFPGTVLGIERGASAAQATRRYAELFGRHRDDTVVG